MLRVDAQRITSKMARPIRSQIMKVVEFKVHKEKLKKETSLSQNYNGAAKPAGRVFEFEKNGEHHSSLDIEIFESILKKAKNLGW
jgi:hypothetical protein